MEQDAKSKSSLFDRWGQWISVRRNFLVFSVGAGVAAAVLASLFIREQIPPRNWVVLIVLGVIGGYVWGVLMWRFFEGMVGKWHKEAKRDG